MCVASVLVYFFPFVYLYLCTCICICACIWAKTTRLARHTNPTSCNRSINAAGSVPLDSRGISTHYKYTSCLSKQSNLLKLRWAPDWHCQNCQTVYQHQPQCFSGCSGPFWYFHNFPIYPQKWFKLSISLLSMSSNPRPMLWKHQSGGSLSCLKRIRWHYQICLTCANTCHPSPAELAYPTLNYMRGCGKKDICRLLSFNDSLLKRPLSTKSHDHQDHH